jgi:hypothetical protein
MKNLFFLLSLLAACTFSCTNKKTAFSTINHDDFKTIHTDFKLSSKAIEDGILLEAYKCKKKVNDVENSIPLSWKNVPDSTKSLAIIMYYYPKKDNKSEVNSYLLLWDIDPNTTEIPYKMASNGDWFMGVNKDGTAVSYTSPCSHGKGQHQYTIALYALSETPASLPKSNSLEVDYSVFMNAISTVKIIDRTTLQFLDSKSH